MTVIERTTNLTIRTAIEDDGGFFSGKGIVKWFIVSEETYKGLNLVVKVPDQIVEAIDEDGVHKSIMVKKCTSEHFELSVSTPKNKVQIGDPLFLEEYRGGVWGLIF